MKRIALSLLILQGIALRGESREQLADAVAHSDVPRVTYLLRKLGRESIGSYHKGVLLTKLSNVAQTVLVHTKKQHSFLSNRSRTAQVAGGAFCAFVGGYCMMYGYKKARLRGLKSIYNRWTAGQEQRMEDYYPLVGAIPALLGLYIVYNGVYSSSDRVSEAREVRDMLEDHIRKLNP